MNRQYEFFVGGGRYEAPSSTILQVTSEGMLCVSMSTELETYDYHNEQAW
jgi:hypothetical protein